MLKRAHLAWVSAISFMIFQFTFQLSSGALVHPLMRDFGLTASGAGLLTSSYYYIYTLLQTPAGMVLDRYGAKAVLTCGALLAGLGCLLFGASHVLINAFIGRIAFGGGAAFAFVGLLLVTRRNFSYKRYALIVGFAETLGLLSALTGTVGMGYLLHHHGWRQCFIYGGFVAMGIALCCWLFIAGKDAKPTPQIGIKMSSAIWQEVLLSKIAWLNGLYIAITFGIITVFASLWATPFLMIKLGIDLPLASIITSLCFLGAAIGCPLYGYLMGMMNSRRLLLYFSTIMTSLLLSIIFLAPIHSLYVMGVLVFLSGFVCSSYMLTFSISDEISTEKTRNTLAGFTNMLGVISAPILQPFIGFLMDYFKGANESYSLQDYQHALMILPLLMLVATLTVRYLPEKKQIHDLASDSVKANI